MSLKITLIGTDGRIRLFGSGASTANIMTRSMIIARITSKVRQGVDDAKMRWLRRYATRMSMSCRRNKERIEVPHWTN